MKTKVFDFHCQFCHTTFEARVVNAEDTATCPQCARPGSTRRPSALQIALPGNDPGLPRAWRRWADWKEKVGKGEPYRG